MAIPKIVILGAGYGGLITAVNLQKELNYNEAEVTLVNKHHYHYITTHLHEPAAGTASHESVKINIDSVINKEKINFRKGVVELIDTANRRVILSDGELDYDYLVIALGSEPETFGIEGLKEHAFSIRSLNSVRMIREHIEYMFSKYSYTHDDSYITLVVGGAGFTGIEFVGELADRVPKLCAQFDVPLEKVRIINIEAAPTVLPGFDQRLIDYAMKVLTEKGVEFKTNTPIKLCTPDGIVLANGEEIRAKTVVWTGGVRGNSVVEKSGFETMRGRVKVDPYLIAPGYEDVFIIGDSALVFNEEGRPYPPTAQIATQQGETCAYNLIAKIRGSAMKPFVYNYKGTLASLGKGEGIGVIGKTKLLGLTAALMKRATDLRYLFMLGGIPLVLKKGKFLP
jgi:NADH dehydrogenase